MIFTLSFTFKTSVYVAVLFICFCTKPFSKFCRHVAVNKCLFTVVACYLFLRLFIASKQYSLDANICCNIPYALSQFFLSLHTSYFQRGLMCYKIGGKLKNRFGQHEPSLIFYSVLFAPSIPKSQTKLSLACAEFTFARVELSPVCFTDLICFELTQVRVSSKF